MTNVPNSKGTAARWLAAAAMVLLIAGCASLSPSADSRVEARAPLKVAFFSVDATPPLGHPLVLGLTRPLEAVDDPLLAKGIVLTDGRSRYILCALDWVELHGEANDLLRRKIAEAAGVDETHVRVHTLHQHTAPGGDTVAQQLLDREPAPLRIMDLPFMAQLADRIAAEVRSALDRARRFTHVGIGSARVEKFASTRRILQENGRVLVRYSTGAKNAALAAAPEGKIDPWLKTLTLYDAEAPLVRLHYYATHPQSYYGDGRATADTVGLARERLEREEGVPQVYFTGCGGDITAGKYNDGTPGARVELTDRIYAGMKAAIAATRRAPVSEMSWKTIEVNLPRRIEPEFAEAAFRKIVQDSTAPADRRILAASALAWYARVKERPGVDISALRLGPATVLHLPGEAFVEYQLYAQRLRPDEFVAVAAYGENGPGYICTDDAFEQGGYEPTWSFVGPPTETLLKAAIAEIIR